MSAQDDERKSMRNTATTSSESEDGGYPQRLPLSKRILGTIWDSLDKSPEERRLIAKLDWWILSYVCVAYFIKYLDQTNVSNAYVSGMKEDLKLKGNDLNYLTTYWTIGYIIGNLPSQVILTKVRPSIWLPTLEIIWSILVIGMAGAKNVTTIYTLRFFIGLLEASAYPGIMSLLGSWYTPAELGKRSCIFQASSSAAQMFSGYLQAALYKGMNGRSGMSAWQWLFILDGIIGIPIALYGFWAVPDSPTDTRSRWLTAKERELSIERMKNAGHAPPRKLTPRTFFDVGCTWAAWLFSLLFIAHVCGIRIYSYFNVWLKSTGRYSVEQVNLIPTAGFGAQIIFTLSYAWISDALQMRWPIIIFAAIIALIGTIILSVWPANNIPAMMTGWILTFLETGAGALIIAWINEVCAYSREHRMLIIGFVETMAFTFNAWVPLLAYNTSQSPHFKVGYKLAAMFFALEIVLTLLIAYVEKRWNLQKQYLRREESQQGQGEQETHTGVSVD
ncbi:pantothenate transporter, putative [Talaromyces stipitatus ATCC 10500]|uniref:Pantothenate transporter, putative n=1 Tax=Talaromyces stipitatus (strain ATCC 10500 / CBS 375.48 / QM 6759 / NRRL 1006) TaxID=441959 RepID=B8M945_TALSN|nr:pantothenate transporter, putative [Talaromyces stipitatus ATCC 10500]EED17340.1 pantothenate transporter, putative [Talaromyces stipitatus ATCC 10500]